MPERLRQLTMSAATMILEHGMAVEQDPVLSAWSWIVGALHQHHCALLLINEVYVVNPEPAVGQRIWRCLDYSFDLPVGLSDIEKIRLVLEELLVKAKKYSELKGICAPNNMPQACSEPGTKIHREDNPSSKTQPPDPRSTDPISHSLAGNMVPPQFVPSHQLKDHLMRTSTLAPSVNSFPGAIPTVSWGNFEMPDSLSAALSVFQQPVFSDFARTTDSGSAMASVVRQAASNHSSPNSATYAGMMMGSAGSDTMDAINDIDWVSTSSRQCR